MIVQRTEIHIIKESNPVYNWILEECLRSRNLYNRVLYVYRQAFTGKHDNIPEFKDIINHDKFIASFALVNRLNEIILEYYNNQHSIFIYFNYRIDINKNKRK